MAVPTHTIKQGDTAPPISAILRGAGGAVQDLTGATVAFNMRNKAAVVVDHGACVVSGSSLDDTSDDVFRAAYNPPDPQEWEIGTYDAEFEVTHASGKVTTFPTVNFRVKVVAQVA